MRLMITMGMLAGLLYAFVPLWAACQEASIDVSPSATPRASQPPMVTPLATAVPGVELFGDPWTFEEVRDALRDHGADVARVSQSFEEAQIGQPLVARVTVEDTWAWLFVYESVDARTIWWVGEGRVQPRRPFVTDHFFPGRDNIVFMVGAWGETPASATIQTFVDGMNR